jgi:DNA mismatch repair protein MutS2
MATGMNSLLYHGDSVRIGVGIGIMSQYRHREKVTPISDELRLRQLTVDEALFKLDQYLHDAFMAGLLQVTVVHGKGTGTLRQAVRAQLARHSLVQSYRPGGYGEGQSGVTIVQLAEK